MDVSLVRRVTGVLLFGVQAGSVDGREDRTASSRAWRTSEREGSCRRARIWEDHDFQAQRLHAFPRFFRGPPFPPHRPRRDGARAEVGPK